MSKYWSQFILFLTSFLLFGVVSAQTFSDDLKLAKTIRLLEEEPNTVVNLLSPDSPFYSEADGAGFFARYSSNIQVWYSTGDCSQVSDSEFMSGSDWNVEKSRVTEIVLFTKDPMLPSDLGLDVSGWRKEKLYRNSESYYIYHDKNKGIAMGVRGGLVTSVHLFPPRSEFSKLCKQKSAVDFYSSNKWRRFPESKQSTYCPNPFANVTEVLLTQTEANKRIFNVSTKANDLDNDPLVYLYKSSGGNIVGSGKEVVWNLSDVGPGTYSLITAVDDGCGLCGKFVTRTVMVD